MSGALVDFHAKRLAGELLDVKIDESTGHTLYGDLVLK